MPRAATSRRLLLAVVLFPRDLVDGSIAGTGLFAAAAPVKLAASLEHHVRLSFRAFSGVAVRNRRAPVGCCASRPAFIHGHLGVASPRAVCKAVVQVVAFSLFPFAIRSGVVRAASVEFLRPAFAIAHAFLEDEFFFLGDRRGSLGRSLGRGSRMAAYVRAAVLGFGTDRAKPFQTIAAAVVRHVPVLNLVARVEPKLASRDSGFTTACLRTSTAP